MNSQSSARVLTIGSFKIIRTPIMTAIMRGDRLVYLGNFGFYRVKNAVVSACKLVRSLFPQAYGVTIYSCDDPHWSRTYRVFTLNRWHAEKVIRAFDGAGDGGNSVHEIPLVALVRGA